MSAHGISVTSTGSPSSAATTMAKGHSKLYLRYSHTNQALQWAEETRPGRQEDMPNPIIVIPCTLGQPPFANPSRDHVNVVVSSVAAVRHRSSSSCRRRRRTTTATATSTPEVVFHLGVKLLLCLFGTRVSFGPTPSFLTLLRSPSALTSGAGAPAALSAGRGVRAARARAAGNVSVNSPPSCICLELLAGRQRSSPARGGRNALREGSPGLDRRVERIPAARRTGWEYGETNGLAFWHISITPAKGLSPLVGKVTWKPSTSPTCGIGPIKVLDGKSRILIAFVHNVGRALRSTGAVVEKVEFEDGADAAKESLPDRLGQYFVERGEKRTSSVLSAHGSQRTWRSSSVTS